MPLSKRAIQEFFERPAKPAHRQYEALRAFLYEGRTARQVAERFGYSTSTVYTLARNFRRLDDPAGYFFADHQSPGRPVSEPPCALKQRIVELREARLSVPDIKACLHAERGSAPSVHSIWRVLREAGFQRLPRRTQAERAEAVSATPPSAPCTEACSAL